MKLCIRKTNIKQKKQGFRARMKTRNGRKILSNRRRRGKKQLTPWN